MSSTFANSEPIDNTTAVRTRGDFRRVHSFALRASVHHHGERRGAGVPYGASK